VTRRLLLRAAPTFAALCGTVAAAAPARAQGPAPAVEVTVVGGDDDLERLRGLVPRLAGGGARWLRVPKLDPAEVLRERRDGDAAAVRAWVDLTVPTRARLAFATRSGERFLVRDLGLSGHLNEVDRAALAEVLESSIGALLANERAGLTRAEVEPMLARPDPPPPPADEGASDSSRAPAPWGQPEAIPRRPRWAPGFFYGAHALGAGGPLAQGPGAALWLAAWPKHRAVHQTGRGPALFASAQYHLPIREQTPLIGVSLQAVAVRAGVECGPLLWSRLRVRLSAGADLVRVAPESANPAAALAAPHWSTSFVASAALRLNLIRPPYGFGLAAALGADVLPTTVNYDATVDGMTSSVFSPWRVRPGITLELTHL
jgi:hypothetical protein